MTVFWCLKVFRDRHKLLDPRHGALTLLLADGETLWLELAHQVLQLFHLEPQLLVPELQGLDIVTRKGGGGGLGRADLTQEEREADLVTKDEEKDKQEDEGEEGDDGDLVDDRDVVEQPREHLANSLPQPEHKNSS